MKIYLKRRKSFLKRRKRQLFWLCRQLIIGGKSAQATTYQQECCLIDIIEQLWNNLYV